MRRFRTVWFVSLVSLVSFLPGSPHGAGGSLHAQGDLGCPLPGILVCPLAVHVPTLVPELPPPGIPLVAAEPCDPPTPVVKIKVRVAACGKLGEPVEYQIRVDNCSPADAHHVVVKNALPSNARFVRASPEPHVHDPEIQWRLGTLKAGGCCDITLVLLPTNLEEVRNCTRIAFEHGQCVTTRVAGMLAPGALPPGASGPPQVVPVPKDTPKDKGPGKEPGAKEPAVPGATEDHKLVLSIEGPKTQYLDMATRYFVTVANRGKLAATNLLVDFTLADKTTFVQANEEGKHVLGKVAWLLGTLEPGKDRTVVVTLKATALGELCHKATALADKGAKAEAQFCTTFAGVSALLLEMVDTEDPIPVGGSTSYPIYIRNTGSAPVTNVRLRAFIPEALTLTRAKAPVNHNLGEPVQGAKVLIFDPLATLAPGAQADYVIFVQGAKPSDVRFRIEMRADQLEGGPVLEEESTRVYAEESGPTVGPSPPPTGPPPPPGQSVPPIRDVSLIAPYRP